MAVVCLLYALAPVSRESDSRGARRGDADAASTALYG
jgi:hypothetical protein